MRNIRMLKDAQFMTELGPKNAVAGEEFPVADQYAELAVGIEIAEYVEDVAEEVPAGEPIVASTPDPVDPAPSMSTPDPAATVENETDGEEGKTAEGASEEDEAQG